VNESGRESEGVCLCVRERFSTEEQCAVPRPATKGERERDRERARERERERYRARKRERERERERA